MSAAPAPVPRLARAKLAALALGAFAVNFSLTGLVFLSPLLVEGAPYALIVTLMVLPSGAGIFLAARLSDAGHERAVGIAGATALGLAPLAFVLGVPLYALVLAGIAYFLGHSALSAQMPALAAAHAPEARRGAAQGAQSTLQYVGSASGSVVAAALYPSAPLLAAAFVGAGALAGVAVAMAAR